MRPTFNNMRFKAQLRRPARKERGDEKSNKDVLTARPFAVVSTTSRHKRIQGGLSHAFKEKFVFSGFLHLNLRVRSANAAGAIVYAEDGSTVKIPKDSQAIIILKQGAEITALDMATASHHAVKRVKKN